MIDKAFLYQKANEYGMELSEHQLNQFDVYADLLVEWNHYMNLTGITEPDKIVIKHFIDSLLLTGYFDINRAETVIDVGTGAGFPSVPLLIYKPELKLTLMDSLKKRLTFLEEVLNKTGLNAKAVHMRAEDAGRSNIYREAYDLACARAVAPMNVLAEYCLPFVKVGGYFVALKGANDDVTSAKNAIEELGGSLIDYVSYKLEDENRSIAIVKKISQTMTKYPRNTKKISSKPL